MQKLNSRIEALEAAIDGDARGVFITGNLISFAEWDATVPAAQALLVKETMAIAERVPVAKVVQPAIESKLRPNWAGKFYGPRQRRPSDYGRNGN
jgi:hypothetical protein